MWPFRKPRQQTPYHALIDSTGILLALHTNPAVIAFLNEATPDTFSVYSINFVRPERPFPPSHVPASQYPDWMWSQTQLDLSRTDQKLRTGAMRHRSRLAVARGNAITSIMRNVSTARYPMSTGVLFQEQVYTAKKTQAEAFKLAGYPERDVDAYPYVAQSAETGKITPAMAADEILFKAKLDDETLLKTEALRLHYFNKVRAIEDPAHLKKLLDEFYHDFNIM